MENQTDELTIYEKTIIITALIIASVSILGLWIYGTTTDWYSYNIGFYPESVFLTGIFFFTGVILLSSIISLPFLGIFHLLKKFQKKKKNNQPIKLTKKKQFKII